MGKTVSSARSDDGALLTLAELAAEAGVAVSSLRNWTRLEGRPLRTTPASDGTPLCSWSELADFCAANPGQSAARRIRRQLSALATVSPAPDEGEPQIDASGPDAQHEPAAERPQRQQPSGETNLGLDLSRVVESWRALRSAADSALTAATTAAELAEQMAANHRRQIDQLAASLRAYDDALTQLLGPEDPTFFRQSTGETGFGVR